MIKNPPGRVDSDIGGGCGIRTHVRLPSNGFQDRLVMTASITLRMGNVEKKSWVNGFQDSCPSRNIVEMRALHSKSSFLLIAVTRSPRRHTVSSRLRSPVMTASITLRVGNVEKKSWVNGFQDPCPSRNIVEMRALQASLHFSLLR